MGEIQVLVEERTVTVRLTDQVVVTMSHDEAQMLFDSLGEALITAATKYEIEFDEETL